MIRRLLRAGQRRTDRADVAVGRPGPVTVIHDYLTQRGGAERVAILFATEHGGRAMETSAVILDRTFPEVADLTVRSLLQGLPTALIRRRATLGPLAGFRFLIHAVHEGVVLCSSSGWSHWVRGRAPRLVYCHTPARWLYEPDDYFVGLRPGLRRLLSVALAPVRAVDRRRMAAATTVVANGPVTAQRIKRVYGIEARVVIPPAGIDATGPQEAVAGVQDDFYLVVGRPRGYKNLDLVTSVFAQRQSGQLIVVGGQQRASADDSIRELGRVSDAQLRWLYEHARAVICLAHEDLGLVPLEAFQFGTPAVALEAGGYLATCTPGVNAVFVESEDADALVRALDILTTTPFDAQVIRDSARQFTPAGFHRIIGTLLSELADDGSGGSQGMSTVPTAARSRESA
jgi:glycosyltransferase involved in cell wall biosynthesis